MGYSWQKYWSGLPFPLPGDLPTQGSNPCLQYLLHWPLSALAGKIAKSQRLESEVLESERPAGNGKMPAVSLEHRWDVIAFTSVIWFVTNPEKPSQGLIPPSPSLYPPDIHRSSPWLLGDQKTTVLLVCYFTALLSSTFDSFKLACLASSQVSPGSAPASSCPAYMHPILQGWTEESCLLQ